MEKRIVYSALPYLYSSDDRLQYTPDVKVTFDNDIDGEKLKAAVREAVEQFPESKLTIRQGAQDFYFCAVEEGAELPVYPESEKPDRMISGTNGYLFCISYEKNTIRLNFLHALWDGICSGNFLEKVMAIYFGVDSNVLLNEDKCYDSFELETLQQAAKWPEVMPDLATKEVHYPHTSEIKRALLRLSNQEFKKLCFQLNEKPYVVLMSFFNSCFQKMGRKELLVKIVVNMRRYLSEKPETIIGNCGIFVNLLCSLDGGADFDTINRSAKETLDKALQKEYLVKQQFLLQRTVRELSKKKLPISVKKSAYKRIASRTLMSDYWFCYNADVFKNTAFSSKVKNMEVWSIPEMSNFGLEIIQSGENFNLCFSYAMESDEFFEYLKALLEEWKLSYEYKKISVLQEMHVDIPKD